ncbi:hypothetical protein [Bosea sp. AK1]|uniref:hypothetical protein n=1 Tax=Bosea sp. AK1 TaxID=2587160 RepID=UPI0011540D7A|nr:hypothetical protein [Bosea sp. AK1]
MVTSTYRNAKGVAMKLKAMAQQDPAFRALGRKGLRAVSIDAQVWRDLAEAPVQLAREIDRILTAEGIAWSIPVSTELALTRTQGPVPSFGSVTAERLDSECVVYVLRFHGPLESLFASGQIPEGSIVAKLGRSNDPMRRVSELSAGFPPGARLGWTIIATVEFPTGNAAHTAEQALLVSSELKGWTLGGEFVVAPEQTLLADLQALADSRDATPK